MRKICWIIFFFLISACVEPVNFNVSNSESQLVVDGMITDEPGPYTIKLSVTNSIGNSAVSIPVLKATITISSSAGESEDLIELDSGVYQTKNIQGRVGTSYSIRIALSNGGAVFESDPELMTPVGEVNAVDFEYERYFDTKNGEEVEGNRFNIFADAESLPDSKYVRWRLLGTYKILNFPQNRVKYTLVGDKIVIVPDPVPCSGFQTNTPCTCCTCWVSTFGLPTVSDNQLVANGIYKRVPIGSVEITKRTFYDKYYVEVQQMSLTEPAYNFWKLVQAQKQGASSVFQPVFGKLKGNVHNVNFPDQTVSGYFGAVSVRRKGIFLMRSDVPFQLPPIDEVDGSCIGMNSTNVQPSFWQ